MRNPRPSISLLFRAFGPIPVLILATFWVAPASLPGQEPETVQLYKKPAEILTRAEMDPVFAAENQEKPDCETLLPLTRDLLERYYGQFLEGKRILYERNLGPRLDSGLDVDAMRKLRMERSRMRSPIRFLGNSPYLATLHRERGRCLELQGESGEALGQYTEALRYTAFENPYPSDRSPEEREDIYRQMLSGFALKERSREDRDPGVEGTAKTFRENYELYQKTKRDLAEARRDLDVVRADLARGKAGSLIQAGNEIERLEKEEFRLKEELEAVRKGSFADYLARKRRGDGELFYRIARILHAREIDDVELALYRQRIQEARAVGGGIRIPEPGSRTDGYRSFLEMAYRLDPGNPEYISLLGEEYGKSRESDAAILMEEEFLRRAGEVATPPAPPVLQEHHMRLGRLYSDTGNPLKSTEHYEEALRLAGIAGEGDGEEADWLRRVLAQNHFQKTGHLERARELYLERVERRKNQNPEGLPFEEKIDFYGESYTIQKNLATIERRFQRSEAEIQHLEQAEKDYGALEELQRGLLEQKEELQGSLNALKAGLLDREDPDMQRDYYRKKRFDLPGLEEKLRSLRIRMDSLNSAEDLERLAFLLVRNRQDNRARELYQEILKRGDSGEKTRSRANLVSLEESRESGSPLHLQLPPGFER